MKPGVPWRHRRRHRHKLGTTYFGLEKHICRKPPCQQVQRKFCWVESFVTKKKTTKTTGRYFWFPFLCFQDLFVDSLRVSPSRLSTSGAFVFFPSRKIVTKSTLVKMWRWTWSLNSRRRARAQPVVVGWDSGLRYRFWRLWMDVTFLLAICPGDMDFWKIVARKKNRYVHKE